MTWLDLVLAAIGGALAGWFAHALLRNRLRRRPEAKEALPNAGLEPPRAPIVSGRAVGPPVRPVVGSQGMTTEADAAGRVILHLASLGRLGNDEIGRLGHTQRGMCEALGIQQGTLAKVLSRLIAAKVIEVDRRHVAGQPRRLNVYRLTALGESVARDLRHRETRETARLGIRTP